MRHREHPAFVAWLPILSLVGGLAVGPGCGGQEGATPATSGDASANGSGDGSVGPGASSGGGAGSSGAGSSGAGSGGGLAGASSCAGSSSSSGGSSNGGMACPPAPPPQPGCVDCNISYPCSVEGQVCHYPTPSGATDCGCTGGVWACYSGCSPGGSSHDINPAQCEPQLETTTACNPYAPTCAFTFAVPCWGDAGLPPPDLDAGASQCAAWCKAVAPADYQGSLTSLRCQVQLVDAGADAGAVLVGQCGGCGI
jgi:hypothetical protein